MESKPAKASPVLPIALLIQQLKADEPDRRINSLNSLGVIAKALGKERARKELLPFLKGKR